MTGLLAMPAVMMLYFFSIVRHSFKCMIYIISFFHPYCLLDSDNGGQTEEADAFDEGEVLLCFE